MSKDYNLVVRDEFDFELFMNVYEELKKTSKLMLRTSMNKAYFDGYFQALCDLRRYVINCSKTY